MNTTENKALIRRYYDEMWNRWRFDVADEIIAADIRFRGSLAIEVAGIEQFKGYMRTVQAAFPDFNNTIELIIGEGEQVFARLTYRGTHKGVLFGITPRGKEVSYAGAALFTIRGGKVAEGWVLGDTLTLRRQLGATLNFDEAPGHALQITPGSDTRENRVHPMILNDAIATVGKTPMVELGRLAKDLPGRVVAKLEMRNPCGSVKDRVGVAMIEDAECRGVLRQGMTLVEPTGGNTGIGLAFAAAIKGYRIILTMPETMSREKVALLRHLGAEVVLTPGILLGDAVALAEQLVEEVPRAIMLDQFRNRQNPDVHRRTTAVEVWEDTGGAVDVFVSAVGTGGTITGVGEVLKQRKPSVRIVAVEPAGAAVLSGGPVGNHLIPGIGVGFIPEVLNRSILDEVIAVTDEEAFACARRLARQEGILAGVSSGAALHAALAVAARKDAAGRMIVVVLADTAERYVTTTLFAD